MELPDLKVKLCWEESRLKQALLEKRAERQNRADKLTNLSKHYEEKISQNTAKLLHKEKMKIELERHELRMNMLELELKIAETDKTIKEAIELLNILQQKFEKEHGGARSCSTNKKE